MPTAHRLLLLAALLTPPLTAHESADDTSLRRVDSLGASTYRYRYTAVWQRGGAEGWQLMALHMGQAPVG